MLTLLPGDPLLDPLTGALSRHHFDPLLVRMVEQATAARDAAALLVIDIDHFKSVNDSFGHSRGDAALVEFTRRARAVLRADDLLFRFGGDEFVLLLPGTTRAQAQWMGERVLDVVRREPFPGTPPLHLTLSVGAAAFPEDAATPAALFEAADRRTYQAKRAGRACVVAHDAPRHRGPIPVPERLIERDVALAQAHGFLDSPDATSRALCLRGAPGSGLTRFLDEVARAGAARGFVTLTVGGTPALRARHCGALRAALAGWPVPSPGSSPAQLAEMLARAALARGADRVLLAIDDPGQMDDASLDLLRALIAAPALPGVLVVYVDGPAWARYPPLDRGHCQTASLEPLSHQGVVVWLRQTLAWEPPPDLVAWISGVSAGLPRDIRQALDTLSARGALAGGPGQWAWEAGRADWGAVAPAAPPAVVRLLDGAPPLVGRDREVAALRALLLTERLVTLVGQGGLGKTRLALQVAAESVADFGDGASFVPLAGVSSEAFIASTIATALQLPVGAGSDPAARLKAHLSSRELLVVLDNVEHLAGLAPVIAELLRDAPGLRLLLTSRTRLALPSERVVVLDGLGQGADPAEDAAWELFCQRARLAAPGFTPSAEDAAAITRICRLLDGLPLGIELAASRLPGLSCPALLAELERGQAVLADHRPDLEERHRSLTAVLDSFWATLSPYERQSLQGLAVFRGGFTFEAARAVAGASPFFLDGLLAKTYVRRAARGRAEMHELLRQYAAARLRGRPLAERRIHDRHSAYYLALVVDVQTTPGRQVDADDLHAEVNNIRAAWEWSIAHGELGRVAATVDSLVDMLHDLGLGREGLGTIEAALSRLPALAASDPLLLAGLETKRAVLLFSMSRFAEALAAVRRAEAALGDTEAQAVRARASHYAGVSLLMIGDHAQAEARFEQALRLAGDEPVLASDILTSHGYLAAVSGKPGRGAELCHAGREQARAAGFLQNQHIAELFLGIGLFYQERHADARAALERILSRQDILRSLMGSLFAMIYLARTSWAVQAYARADSEIQRAVARTRETDMRYMEGIALLVQGMVARSGGRLAEATIALADAERVCRTIGARRDLSRVLTEQALLAQMQGDLAAARELAEDALTQARRHDFQLVLGDALIHHGHALLGLGEPAAAHRAYAEGRDLLRAQGRANRAAEALSGVVAAELARGRRGAAAAGARRLIAHLRGGQATLGGMYDPAAVVGMAHRALVAEDPAEAEQVRAWGHAMLARVE